MTENEYSKIFQIASKHYSKKTLNHAVAVMHYVEKDPRFVLLEESDQWFVKSLAISHDLIEDTSCKFEELSDEIHSLEEKKWFEYCLELLTFTESLGSYFRYIERIVESGSLFAIMVKQSDMKDHFMRKNTLTKKLKKKYAKVIPLLIGR